VEESAGQQCTILEQPSSPCCWLPIDLSDYNTASMTNCKPANGLQQILFALPHLMLLLLLLLGPTSQSQVCLPSQQQQ
jgi:hypothetical protein